MMKLKTALTLCGFLILILGLVWMGQGSGAFPYPEQSFMINQQPWVTRGAIFSVIGLVLIWGARRFVK